MSVYNNTCKGCEKRQIGCHGTCEKYLTWQSENEKRKEAVHKENDIKWALRDIIDRRRKKHE